MREQGDEVVAAEAWDADRIRLARRVPAGWPSLLQLRSTSRVAPHRTRLQARVTLAAPPARNIAALSPSALAVAFRSSTRPLFRRALVNGACQSLAIVSLECCGASAHGDTDKGTTACTLAPHCRPPYAVLTAMP